MDGGGATPVGATPVASIELALSTLLVAVVDLVVLFDALLDCWRKSPTTGPGLRSVLIRS